MWTNGTISPMSNEHSRDNIESHLTRNLNHIVLSFTFQKLLASQCLHRQCWALDWINDYLIWIEIRFSATKLRLQRL